MKELEVKKIFLVKLGNLFYAGGHPYIKDISKIMTFHFVSYEEAATIFGYRDVANKIAEQVGGKVITKEITESTLDFLLYCQDYHHEKMVNYGGKKLLPVNNLI